MVSLCALLAYKRGEVQCFWTGVFFDEILLDPYKHDGPNNFDVIINASQISLKSQWK